MKFEIDISLLILLLNASSIEYYMRFTMVGGRKSAAKHKLTRYKLLYVFSIVYPLSPHSNYFEDKTNFFFA